jgi:hypothetical protein
VAATQKIRKRCRGEAAKAAWNLLEELGKPARVLQLKPRLMMTYDKHILGIYQWKLEILHDTPLVVESCFVCVGVMSYVSDRSVTCVVRC